MLSVHGKTRSLVKCPTSYQTGYYLIRSRSSTLANTNYCNSVCSRNMCLFFFAELSVSSDNRCQPISIASDSFLQPLVRQDLPEIVKALSSLDGVRNVGVTTNGINLRRKIPALRDAGLTHINVSAPLGLPNILLIYLLVDFACYTTLISGIATFSLRVS